MSNISIQKELIANINIKVGKINTLKKETFTQNEFTSVLSDMMGEDYRPKINILFSSHGSDKISNRMINMNYALIKGSVRVNYTIDVYIKVNLYSNTCLITDVKHVIKNLS